MLTRTLHRVPYGETFDAMRRFTQARSAGTEDELWLCEHPPVFTQGVAGRAEHVVDAHGVPVVATDRGGQVTYHGPGQVVAYPLVDLRRLRIYVKEYVFRLEAALIQTLDSYGIAGQRVRAAPGIYVDIGAQDGPMNGLAKIAALGIKVSNHCAYHGVALNVAMDLKPFTWINPCGYAGLATVDLATLNVHADWADAARRLGERLATHLSP
jgi:lipoyl(octanoyl) transferase